MNYYSSTTTTEPAGKKSSSDVKFDSNDTHHVIRVAWEHCYSGATDIKVTNAPLTIKANSFDGINHHSLELNLTLNYDIVTLTDAYYDSDDKEFRIYIPKKNMKRQEKETVSLPKKS